MKKNSLFRDPFLALCLYFSMYLPMVGAVKLFQLLLVLAMYSAAAAAVVIFSISWLAVWSANKFFASRFPRNRIARQIRRTQGSYLVALRNMTDVCSRRTLALRQSAGPRVRKHVDRLFPSVQIYETTCCDHCLARNEICLSCFEIGIERVVKSKPSGGKSLESAEDRLNRFLRYINSGHIANQGHRHELTFTQWLVPSPVAVAQYEAGLLRIGSTHVKGPKNATSEVRSALHRSPDCAHDRASHVPIKPGDSFRGRFAEFEREPNATTRAEGLTGNARIGSVKVRGGELDHAAGLKPLE